MSGQRAGSIRSWPVLPILLAGVPVVVAVAGPWLAGLIDPARGPSFGPRSPGHVFGTDATGRDVLRLALQGGRSMVTLTIVTSVAAYAAGSAIGIAAASRRGIADELLMRPLDVLLALPPLLIVLLLASGQQRGVAPLVAAVAAVNVPSIARIVRAAALEASSSPAAEAMLLAGESRAAIHLGYVGRSVLRPVIADLGSRLTATAYLVASANFLGVGLPPTSADWAVTVDRNRAGLLLQPWAVVLPAVLIVAFAVGSNLLADRLLARARPANR